MLDLQQIKRNYQSYDDDRILKILRYDIRGLRDEVVPILISEIRRRSLGENFVRWVLAERRILSDVEFEELRRKLVRCTCTNCNEKSDLQGHLVETEISYIIGGRRESRELILCEACGKSISRNAIALSFILGWWSLRGIFVMPLFLYRKIKLALAQEPQSDGIVNSFLKKYIGVITLHNNTKHILQRCLESHNNGVDLEFEINEM